MLIWISTTRWELNLEPTSGLKISKFCLYPATLPSYQSVTIYLFRIVPGLTVSFSEFADQEGSFETTVSTSAVGTGGMGSLTPWCLGSDRAAPALQHQPPGTIHSPLLNICSRCSHPLQVAHCDLYYLQPWAHLHGLWWTSFHCVTRESPSLLCSSPTSVLSAPPTQELLAVHVTNPSGMCPSWHSFSLHPLLFCLN